MHYGNFTKAADAAFERGAKHIAKRIKIEGRIAAALIDAILAKEGCTISLFDCEEWTVRRSQDKTTIIQAMFTTDEDTIRVRDAEGNNLGFFYFIYGNSGWDVISDYAANDFCEKIMEEIQPVIDRAEYDMA